ncbi:MAG: CotH kinase family protein, partial [Candidatus Delongbacteria bacterium]|nr:CotH kinase family protein [Candidatus Delongbacteria bacterium]
MWLCIGAALVFSLLYLHNKFSTQLSDTGDTIDLFMGFEAGEEPSGAYGINFREIDKKHITSEKAFQGERSLFISEEREFQNLVKISKPRTNQYFSITLQCNADADPILVAQAKGKLYEVSKTVLQSGDWKLKRTEFFIPPTLKNEDIGIYIWNKLRQDVWIDSLAIYSAPKKTYPEFDSLQTVHLLINDEPWYKLKNARKLAFEEGNIMDESKKEYAALLNTGGKLNDINIRLKGDWLDHIKGDKWSFRIEMSDNSWKGMREFSIQSPHTRDFLREWFIHKIARDEGLLSTRYGFIGVYLNGESKGIYAYEEHFKKQIVESASHREGPILKMDESEFWENVNQKMPGDHAFETCEIRAFGENKIRKSPSLWQYFDLAQNLVNHYRWLSAPANEIFDIDKTARTFALLDCMYAKHGFRWHNQRFYYNPVISRLQPIIFDCYGTDVTFDSTSNIFGRGLTLPQNVIYKRNNHLFKDSLFRKAYFDAVKEYSDPAFLNKYLDKYAESINTYEGMIQQEFPYYSFDVSVFRKRSSQVRDSLDNFIAHFNSTELPEAYAKLGVEFPGPSVNKADNVNIQHCVNVFAGNMDSVSIYLINDNKIIFTGFGNKNKRRTDLNKQPQFHQTSVYKIAKIPYPDYDYKYIYFKPEKTDEEMSVKIINLPEPGKYNPKTELNHRYQIDKSYLNANNQYVIESGNHDFLEPVIIPCHAELIIEAGTTISFSDEAGLISYSPVNICGTPNNKVNIIAEDTVSGYFVVLGAEEKSVVKHCNFKNQNTLSYNGWILTGAVTFYESDVEIKHSGFFNNHSEDALNIIRSDFVVSDCLFYETFSDAFDSDFCTGSLTSSHFENTGNDAIDFSGSQIDISNCKMMNIGDKAVSGGEASTLKLNDLDIDNAVTGISSKDLSVVTGNNIKINNVTYGVLLLEKKPDYGPANLTITNSSIKNAIHRHLVEQGSVFVFNGRKIKGNKRNLKAVFY